MCVNVGVRCTSCRCDVPWVHGDPVRVRETMKVRRRNVGRADEKSSTVRDFTTTLFSATPTRHNTTHARTPFRAR